MTNLPWATPESLGRLTLPQLLCVGSDRPPSGGRLTTAEDFAAFADRRKAEKAEAERAWNQAR